MMIILIALTFWQWPFLGTQAIILKNEPLMAVSFISAPLRAVHLLSLMLVGSGPYLLPSNLRVNGNMMKTSWLKYLFAKC